MEPANDVDENVETLEEVTTDVLPPFEILVYEDYPWSISHDGRYVRYDLFGDIFEVTSKYKPPLEHISRAAHGIISAMNSETNENVAITRHVFNNKIDAKRTLLEIKLLRHLNHENIVGIKDVILPRERQTFKDVYIACELMDADLEELLDIEEEELTLYHYKVYLYLILRGLKYMHSANVLHRDLKPGNILVNNCDLKIYDFSLACASPGDHFMPEYAVNRWYHAPELILNSSAHTTAIDVWSVGCIFLEMFNREPIFPDDADGNNQLSLIVELIGTPSEEELGALDENAKQYLRQFPPLARQSFSEKFPNVPPLAIDLVEKMLTFDSRQRITAKEALCHPYFNGLHDNNDEPECMAPFTFDLDVNPLTEEQLREMVYNEALDFNNACSHCKGTGVGLGNSS